MRLTHLLTASALLAAGIFGSRMLAEPEPVIGPATVVPAVAVAELFTSQGCSSCPPAESVFNDISRRSDVVVIQWHVDYWDKLLHGRAGAWKDPFSSHDYTLRQSAYNSVLRGKPDVYTPQAVINGIKEVVGSRRGEVMGSIDTAGAADIDIHFTPNGTRFAISVETGDSGAFGPAEIRFVRLLQTQETAVKRGENQGRLLRAHNIALDTKIVGNLETPMADRMLPVLKPGETCAIIIQETRANNRPGRILGGAYCPV